MKISITPLIAGKPWCGATIYEAPLGGSEKAVVYLARELGRRGHDVTVYTHGQPGVFEKVQYLPMPALQQPEACDVHISSRWLAILGGIPCKTSLLWLHDLPPGSGVININAEQVVCISAYQRAVWNFNPEDPRVHIIGDGVDLALFSGQEVRHENRLLWISNPDRGLYIAAKIFTEQLLPRWPDLEFHVYGRYAVYGWAAEQERMFLPSPHPRIILKQPLPSLALARELMKAWALFYPTYWPETFCMAALEAQAAETPIITSNFGALPETIKGGILTNDFVNAVSQLRNRNRWEKLALAGRKQAKEFSWARIAQQWEKLMKEALA